MGAAYFYHLTRSPLDRALALLVQKALGAGWRVVVRGTDAARLDWLDTRLWLDPEAVFLPHGRAGGPHDADQPVLLTTTPDIPNAARCLMTIDGAAVTARDCTRLDRSCVLFDGNDAESLARARHQWKELTDADIPAQYWSEETGHWQKKAER